VDLYKINRQFAPDSVYLRAYQKLYKDYVIFGLNLNLICMNLALKKAFKENKVTVIYSDNLDHLLLLYLLFYEFTKQKQLPELFEQIKPIHGKLSNKERDRLVQELKEGKYKIALVSDILTTGYNIPNIECMFYLANKGASSLVTPLQFLGRGHRITKEKKYFEYYDLSVDLAYIDKANKNRIREYEKEGYNTKSIIMKTTDQLKDIVQKMYQNIVDSAEDLLNDPQLNNAFGVHMQTCFLHDIIKNKNRSSKPIINKKFSTDFKIL
jgi:superfamily II DNA or RNA helicase